MDDEIIALDIQVITITFENGEVAYDCTGLSDQDAIYALEMTKQRIMWDIWWPVEDEDDDE
jgi:hypothetical protein